MVYSQIIPELKQSEPEFVEAVVPFIVYSLTVPFELQDKFKNTTYTFMEYEFEYEAAKIMAQRLGGVFEKFEIDPNGNIGMCIIEIWRNSIEELGKISESWRDLYLVMSQMSNR
ncbi:hypothetical protein [Heyndrickxia faecalis]|uniref:hypothetical protein n=1 Tax=Heyndrickxia faecalis TaxID=2824910 RepID=UPI001B3A0133|nr:hypothetical protein [Heyndrickxia faecalis]MBQ4912049.1 hypothetical protein [Heyndrickxia faecalis]